MSFILIILFMLSLITILGYILLMFALNYGWFRITSFKTKEFNPSTKLSILLPIRNEQEYIEETLREITSQNYPEELLEIILIDDFSDDNTLKIIEEFCENKNAPNLRIIQLAQLANSSGGKKAALTEGVNQSKGELILTTDADCKRSKNWARTIVSYYENNKVDMISAPVALHHEKGLFSQLQALEFLSLIGAGAASVELKNPIMCNGANLAFTKTAFTEVNGYNTKKPFSSGDDIFLLLKIKKLSNKIAFIKNHDAMVHTKPLSSLSQFISQRTRWASKSRGYTDDTIIGSAALVYFYNLTSLFWLICGLFNPPYLGFFLFLFLVKLALDFPLLLGITSFAKNKKLLLWYIPLQFILQFYIVFVGTFSHFISFSWKGRQYKRGL